MTRRRVKRVAELLREVVSDVITKKMKNPHLPDFVTLTKVELSNDLQNAKIFITVIGDDETKKKALDVLNSAKGFISTMSSKEMDLRVFPELRFILDDTLDAQIHLEGIIQKIQEERRDRDGEEERGSSPCK